MRSQKIVAHQFQETQRESDTRYRMPDKNSEMIRSKNSISPKEYIPLSQAKNQFNYSSRETTTAQNIPDIYKFMKEANDQGVRLDSLKETLDMYIGLNGQINVSQLKPKTDLKHRSMDQLSLKLLRERFELNSSELNKDDKFESIHLPFNEHFNNQHQPQTIHAEILKQTIQVVPNSQLQQLPVKQGNHFQVSNALFPRIEGINPNFYMSKQPKSKLEQLKNVARDYQAQLDIIRMNKTDTSNNLNFKLGLKNREPSVQEKLTERNQLTLQESLKELSKEKDQLRLLNQREVSEQQRDITPAKQKYKMKEKDKEKELLNSKKYYSIRKTKIKNNDQQLKITQLPAKLDGIVAQLKPIHAHQQKIRIANLVNLNESVNQNEISLYQELKKGPINSQPFVGISKMSPTQQMRSINQLVEEEIIPKIQLGHQLLKGSQLLQQLQMKGLMSIQEIQVAGRVNQRKKRQISPPKANDESVRGDSLLTNSPFQQKVQQKRPKQQIIDRNEKQEKQEKWDGIFFKEAKFSKDPNFQEKYSSLRNYYNVLNLGNQLFVQLPQQTGQVYKAYVGKGNNSLMVRMLIKNRWWWQIIDQPEDETINFIFTQLRQQSFLDSLKSLKKISIQSQPGQSTGDSFHSSVSSSTPLPPIKKSTQEDLCVDSSEDESIPYISTKRTQSSNLQQVKKPKDNDWSKLISKQEFTRFQNVIQKSNRKESKILTLPQAKSYNLESKLSLYEDPQQMKCHNHVENNFHLGNKKALFYNMRSYYESIKQNVFDNLPLTFHIQNSKDDPEYLRFIEAYKQRQEEMLKLDQLADQENTLVSERKKIKRIKNIWIIKPGEFTNRGNGIKVSNDFKEIQDIIKSKEVHKNGSFKTYIVQLYLDRPLLYNRRKFDIRCYTLFTSINGYQKAYWYQEGYIRTSSKEFSNKNLTSKMIHLTNDAVQKKGDDYGKFERGNKVSYEDFQKYLDTLGDKIDFYKHLYPRMKQLAKDSIRAAYGRLDPSHKENNFEVYGLDFMIDDSYRVWLIEVNTNPCLEVSSPVLAKIIPPMMDNAFRIALDPIFPPPQFYNPKKFCYDNPVEQNKFELIFSEQEDGQEILLNRENMQNCIYDFGLIVEESEEDEEPETNDIQ